MKVAALATKSLSPAGPERRPARVRNGTVTGFSAKVVENQAIISWWRRFLGGGGGAEKWLVVSFCHINDGDMCVLLW